MKRGDFWLIGIIAAAAVLLLAAYGLNLMNAQNYDGKTYARITVDGELYQTVELTDQTEYIEIETAFGYNLLEVGRHGIQMIEADCSDEVCIAMGFKSKIGETIICLPHRVLVEIIGESGEGGEIDAVAI